MPDFLAAHRTGTLAELEARLLAVEQSGSLTAAAVTTRTEIELPGALRYLSWLRRDIHGALAIVRGLHPERFAGIVPTIIAFAGLLGVCGVLMHLRGECARHLPQLPAPLGFDPRRRARDSARDAYQHRAGRDPPHRLIEARVLTPTGTLPLS